MQLVFNLVANKVPPDSEEDLSDAQHCKSKDVFKLNCYRCYCNRLGTQALCTQFEPCINPKAPPFIIYPHGYGIF